MNTPPGRVTSQGGRIDSICIASGLMTSHRRVQRIGLFATAGLFLALLCNSTGAASNPSAQRTSGHLHSRELVAPLGSVVCTSQANCIGVGTHVTPGTRHGHIVSNGGQPNGGFAAMTTDRGALWADTPRLVGVKGLDALACATVRTCIAVGGNPVSKRYVIYKGVVTRTRDGGHTWKVLPTTPKKVGELTSMSCPTAHFCMAVGSSEAIWASAVALVTRSDGQQWTRLTLPKYEPQLELVTCTTAFDCIAEGPHDGQSIIFTSDGGATWTQAQLPTGNYPQGVIGIPILTGLACMSRTDCVLVGGIEGQHGEVSGLILSSADGGRSWSYTALPSGAAMMNAISCPAAMQCVAVGENFATAENDLILTTIDGGQHWVARPVPAAVIDLESVSCPTATTCVATGLEENITGNIGERPVTVASSDGGVTWRVTP
jgi:photosystem II stability/assembly factor-like uncharacterized protein